jgi:glyoxylase-like metal-dependent hydrolase (beta-lactamase superfamily II)
VTRDALSTSHVTSCRPSGISRRTFLQAGLGIALTPDLARPSAAQSTGQAQLHRFAIGSAEVTVMSDGELELPVRFVLPDRHSADVDGLLGLGASRGSIKAAVNVALVRQGGSVILVDTGGGTDFMPGLGKLGDRLALAGVAPDEITHVVFTHGHADHLWGTLDLLTGDTMFEQARHVMTAAERDYWLQPDIEMQLPDAFRNMAVGTQRRLKSISARFETIRAGAEVVPGVTLLDTAGHTPGHVSVRVESGRQQLVIGGDALAHPKVSFSAPEWRWGPDMDADRAAAARRKLLDMLAADKSLLLGYHLPWPGIGRVERSGTVFRYMPA